MPVPNNIKLVHSWVLFDLDQQLICRNLQILDFVNLWDHHLSLPIKKVGNLQFFQKYMEM